MKRLTAFLLLTLPALAQETQPVTAAATADENYQGTVDLGGRWVSEVAGDFNTYRSVVNLNDGFRLLGLDLLARDPKRKLFDQLTLFADNWGDPYNTIRLGAERRGTYRYTFDYRNIAYFNALPSFANPFLQNDVLFNQRSFDIHRKLWNTELELRPGKRIVPFLAFSRDSGDGSGVTPFVSSGNEYPVATGYRDHTNTYRGGARMEFRRWHLTLEQGGTSFKDDQLVSTNDQNFGNRRTPLLGRELFLDSARQAYRIRGSSIFSRGLFTAAPVSWADLNAMFLYSQPESDVAFREDAEGLLYLGATQFADVTEALSGGYSKMPRTSGSFSAEIRPHGRIRVHESIMTDRLHSGSSLLLNFAAFSGAAAGTPVVTNFADRLVTNYNRQQADGFVDLTRKLTLRGGHRYEWGDATVRSGNLNPSGQPESAELKRHVGIAGFNFRPARGWVVNGDYEAGDASRNYFRTSLHDYHQLRLRSTLHLRQDLQAGLNFRYLDNENELSAFDFRDVSAGAHVRWRPGGGKRASVLADYTWSGLRSDLSFLAPPFFTTVASLYRDTAHSGTALADINLPLVAGAAPRLSFGGSFFRSSGSRPTRYWQPVARFQMPMHRHVAGYVEWRYYGLSQVFYSLEAFRAHTLIVGLRLSL